MKFAWKYLRYDRKLYLRVKEYRGLNQTLKQYKAELKVCRDLFLNKSKDYGTSWRILRTHSLTDQIYIKAARIRTVDEKKLAKVDESTEEAFRAIVNYGYMALIQLKNPIIDTSNLDMPMSEVQEAYDKQVKIVTELMERKNHDYGEAWRDLRVSSMTDLILMKLLRIRQIEDNSGKTIVSEGLDANYMDIINYAIFCLIKLAENKD